MMFDDDFVERTKCLLLVLIVLVFMCYLQDICTAVQIRPSDSLLLYQL